MIKGMYLSLGMRLFACIFLTIAAGVVVRGQSAGPNAVVTINGQTMLDCNTFDLSWSNWVHTSDGTSDALLIASGCNPVTGNNAAFYRTELIGGNICRLIIANVTMQQGGVYNCYDGGSSVYRSLVTVIDPVETISICSTVPTDDKCVSKPETLMCSANANPPAQYMWLDLQNNITTAGAVKSISSGGQYQCTASNSIRNQIYNEKKNVTETSCYSPYNLTISGTNCANNLCACNGNSQQISITCMANGIPIPSFNWWNVDYEISGPAIEVTYNGNYSCIATNTYGGKEYSAELSVVVSDCPAGSFSLIWLIFLLYPGVGWILAVLFVIYYGQSGKKNTYNKHFPFLKKMLPCMNTDDSATFFERFGWIILCILMVTFAGIFVIPFMVIKVQFFSSANTAGDIDKVKLIGSAHSKNDAHPRKLWLTRKPAKKM